MVSALPETGQLPVYTLTFANPPSMDIASTCRISHGDVIKIEIPDFKPKSYTMSATRPGEFDVTFKLYPGGRCSGYLDSITVGSTVDVFVMGQKERNEGTHIGVIAFGVGITEAYPIAKLELERPGEGTVKLLWGARTFGDMFWHAEIEKLSEEYPDRFLVTRVLSREDKSGCLKGRIDSAVLSATFGAWTSLPGARFLLVGTKPMMREAADKLTSIGFGNHPPMLLYVP